jgi:sugar lactone lactonase YvrE
MSLHAELVVAHPCEVGESPVWDARQQVLWWTDIEGRMLHSCAPDGSAHKTFAMPGRVGSFAFCERGGMILAMERGFSFYDPDDGRLETLAQPEADISTNRFNDGRCDREGRFLAGSMNLPRDARTGRLWRLDTDGTPHVISDYFFNSNGLAFSPDGRTMYWADSRSGDIFQHDYDHAGKVSNRRLWLDLSAAPGGPDGGTVDADGCYWSARWGGNCVVRFSPDGKVDRMVHVPAEQITMCAFGGSDLRTLYITTAWEGMSPERRAADPLAGALFAVALDVSGVDEPRFQG